MGQHIKNINLIKALIISSLCVVIYSCEEQIEPRYTCVDCVEHSYMQSYGDTSIVLTLVNNIYCLGDSAWETPNNTYWTIIDEDLISLMSESDYCQITEDSIN